MIFNIMKNQILCLVFPHIFIIKITIINTLVV
jgi:hypothetical protein